MPFSGRAVFAVLAVLCCASLGATGQNPPSPPQNPPATNQTPADPQQPPIFRARVNLVRVDVSVLGRDDEAVEGLQPEDFVIEEDGVAQKVETVQFVKLDGQPPADYKESLPIRSIDHAEVEAAKDDVRLFAIFLDDYHVDKQPQIMVPLRRALEDFVKKFAPTDLVAVMDPLTPLTHLKFTRAREELVERMHVFEGRRGELFPVKSAAEEAQLKERNVWALRGGVTLSALHALVTRLGGLREGRKSVLFVSQGPVGAMPGVGSNSSNDMRLQDVIEAANRGNVTIHVLDPRPLGAGPFGGSYVLRRLSDETGGRAIVNTNDPRRGLQQVIDDASAYYLVGYSPAREWADGKFHKIEVKVNRRGVRVLARTGYLAPTEAEMNPKTKDPLAPEVMTALSNLVEPIDGRDFDIWLGVSRGSADGRTRVSITWDPSERYGNRPPARMEIAPLDAAGAPIAEPQIISTGRAAGAPLIATFELAPGPLTLRFTARTADGEVIDQWPERVTVPSMAGTLALSTPRFLRARSAFELRALQADPNPAPAASRGFRKTDRVLVEIECFSTTDAIEVSAELLNSEGRSLLTFPVPTLKGGKARFEIPVNSLAGSTYLLRVKAKAEGKEVSRVSAFQVVP